jgi:hypothetical protein
LVPLYVAGRTPRALEAEAKDVEIRPVATRAAASVERRIIPELDIFSTIVDRMSR